MLVVLRMGASGWFLNFPNSKRDECQPQLLTKVPYGTVYPKTQDPEVPIPNDRFSTIPDSAQETPSSASERDT